MYRMIVFDLDGTLFDTKYAVLTALKDVLKQEKNLDYSIKELEFAFGSNAKEVARHFQMDTKRCSDLWATRVTQLSKHIVLFDGVLDMLLQIQQTKIGMSVATSKVHMEFEQLEEEHPIKGMFSPVVCFEDVKHPKPDKESLVLVSKISKIPLNEMLFLGDSVFDMECAKNAGVDFALAAWGAKEELKEHCDICLNHPSELLHLIK